MIPVICKKPCQFNGRHYQPGDVTSVVEPMQVPENFDVLPQTKPAAELLEENEARVASLEERRRKLMANFAEWMSVGYRDCLEADLVREQIATLDETLAEARFLRDAVDALKEV